MKDTFNYTEFTSEVTEKYSKQFKQYEPIFKLLYNWQDLQNRVLKPALKAFKFCIANYEYNKIENYTYIGEIYAK